MNSKKISIILLIVSLFAILFGNVAIAENCPNLVGNWEVTGKEVCGIRATEEFEYRSLNATLKISDQDGCLFYGYLYNLHGDGLITGIIMRSKITMTGGDVTYTGRLLPNNKIIFAFNENIEQCIGCGIATRTQCTDGIFVQDIGAANGLSFDNNGNLYITDYKNGSLLKVSTPFHSGVNSYETILTGISNIVDLTFTDDGRLFIAGNTFNVYEVFSDGSYSLVADGFSYLTSIESYGNYLYISNSGDGTITKMDKNGNKETFLSGFSQSGGPYGLSIDDDGNLYFVDHKTGIIYKSDQGGNVTSLGNVSRYGGCYTGVDSKNNVYISDVNIGTLYVIDIDGQMSVFADGFSGKDNPPAIGPNDIAFDSSGNIYVADGVTVIKYCASQ